MNINNSENKISNAESIKDLKNILLKIGDLELTFKRCKKDIFNYEYDVFKLRAISKKLSDCGGMYIEKVEDILNLNSAFTNFAATQNPQSLFDGFKNIKGFSAEIILHCIQDAIYSLQYKKELIQIELSISPVSRREVLFGTANTTSDTNFDNDSSRHLMKFI